MFGYELVGWDLEHLTQLRHLNLCANSLWYSFFTRSLAKLVNLEHLNLSQTGLRCDDVFDLISTLQHTPNLKHLDLSYNSIGNKSFCMILSIVERLTKLEHLVLFGCDIDQAFRKIILFVTKRENVITFRRNS